jgi:hypothetical protein
MIVTQRARFSQNGERERPGFNDQRELAAP